MRMTLNWSWIGSEYHSLRTVGVSKPIALRTPCVTRLWQGGRSIQALYRQYQSDRNLHVFSCVARSWGVTSAVLTVTAREQTGGRGTLLICVPRPAVLFLQTWYKDPWDVLYGKCDCSAVGFVP
eukprot:2040583-Rhodomonas_salina.2